MWHSRRPVSIRTRGSKHRNVGTADVVGTGRVAWICPRLRSPRGRPKRRQQSRAWYLRCWKQHSSVAMHEQGAGEPPARFSSWLARPANPGVQLLNCAAEGCAGQSAATPRSTVTNGTRFRRASGRLRPLCPRAGRKYMPMHVRRDTRRGSICPDVEAARPIRLRNIEFQRTGNVLDGAHH
jgi:hypothetical protein